MSEYDLRVAAALQRFLPSVVEDGDWARVLRDAHEAERKSLLRMLLDAARRRRAFALAAICLMAALVTVPALAVTRGWWFLDFGGPTPASAVAVVKSGDSPKGHWTLTAYLSESQGVCVALTMKPPSNIGAQSCGAPVRGAPDALGSKAPRHWLGYTYTAGDATMPGFVFGPTALSVRRVDLVFADGTTKSIDTIAAPSELGLPLRFFVSQVPSDKPVRALVARGASGEAFERFSVPPFSMPQNSTL